MTLFTICLGRGGRRQALSLLHDRALVFIDTPVTTDSVMQSYF